MTPVRHPLDWLPPFLAGLAGAVAAEVSVGLLLYSGLGFLRALTLILATLLGALALGLWTAPSRARSDGEGRLSESVRRRWMLTLVVYVLAAGTAAAWDVLGGLASGVASRGLGLALLAGLPLYSVGSVLGGMAATVRVREGGAGTPSGRIAAAATAGAAAGTALTGLVLVQGFIPASMYVFCLVVLSGGALVHGRVLDRRPERTLVDEEMSPFGLVRVVDVQTGTPRRAERRLTVDGRLRGGLDGTGRALRGWEEAVLELLTPDGDDEHGAVMVVGAGAVELIQGLLERGWGVELVERNDLVRRMAIRHLGLPRNVAGLEVRTAGLLETLEEERQRVRAVVLDGAARGSEGALPLPSAPLMRRLHASLAPGGLLLVGGERGDGLERGEGAALVGSLLEKGSWGEAALFRASDGSRVGGGLLVFVTGTDATTGEDALPRTAGGLVRVEMQMERPGERPALAEREPSS